MAMNWCSLSVGEIKFDHITEDEFTVEMRANIPGVKPEDVRFEQIGNPIAYDEILQLKIVCDTRLSEGEFVNYCCVVPIDLKEFYGFDYRVSNGLLYLKLYKEKKRDIQQLGCGFCFNTKYPRDPRLNFWS